MTDWVSVRLSAELKARVDEVRGDVPLARWVARAVEARLDVEGGPAAPPTVIRQVVGPEPRERPVTTRRAGRAEDPMAARQAALNKTRGL